MVTEQLLIQSTKHSAEELGGCSRRFGEGHDYAKHVPTPTQLHTRPNYVFPEETIDRICPWNERWTQCIDLCEILGLKWIPFVGDRYVSNCVI